MIVAWRKVSVIMLFGLIVLFILVGLWRFEASGVNDHLDHISDYNDKEEIYFEGIIKSEPDIRKDRIKYTVQVDKLVGHREQKNVTGKVLITIPRYPEYNYGDRLNISGKLLSPGEYNDFSYKDYLSKFGIYSVSYDPKIELISQTEGNVAYRSILKIKKKFKEKLSGLMPEPQSSLLNGIILGEKRGLPEDLREQFNLTGVSHIIVISGFHVAIVAGLIMNFCLAISLSRKQSFWISIIGIIFFITITGFQTSAIRAAIMGGLVLLAMYSGRLSNPRNALCLAAVIMLMINPKLLRYDVGFQLSFLATISIIYLSSHIKKYLVFLPKLFKIRESAAMTISAQFLTLPIIVYNFERLSVVAPITNILIVPLVPISMMLGGLVGLIGFISNYLGQALAFLVWILLSYKIAVVENLAAIKYSYYEIYDLWWGWILVYYIFSFYLIYRVSKARKLKEKV